MSEVEMNENVDPTLYKIAVWVCEPCIKAKGEECHTPGCVFIRQTVREWPFHPDEFEVLLQPGVE